MIDLQKIKRFRVYIMSFSIVEFDFNLFMVKLSLISLSNRIHYNKSGFQEFKIKIQNWHLDFMHVLLAAISNKSGKYFEGIV